MQRCNELCTKETTGACMLCEALAERDRFLRFWFQGACDHGRDRVHLETLLDDGRLRTL